MPRVSMVALFLWVAAVPCAAQQFTDDFDDGDLNNWVVCNGPSEAWSSCHGAACVDGNGAELRSLCIGDSTWEFFRIDTRAYFPWIGVRLGVILHNAEMQVDFVGNRWRVELSGNQAGSTVCECSPIQDPGCPAAPTLSNEIDMTLVQAGTQLVATVEGLPTCILAFTEPLTGQIRLSRTGSTEQARFDDVAVWGTLSFPDPDGDGIYDWADNCPDVFNPDQADVVHPDGIGDACDDPEGDGVTDDEDNCPDDPNSDQSDADTDGVGDICDNCPSASNPQQEDQDADGTGDICDLCVADPDPQTDADGDGVGDTCDNCPSLSNPGQEDQDLDDVGDVCDGCPVDPQNDIDGDGLCADADNCPEDANLDQADGDADGVGDVCDNCPDLANPGQETDSGGGVGSACSADLTIGITDEVDAYVPGTSIVYRVRVLNVDGRRQNFEQSGPDPGPQWNLASSESGGRIRVTDQYGAAVGTSALLMDRTGSTSNNLNEAIWTVNLTDVETADLHFWHAEWNDEQHFFDGEFVGSFNADGIAISDDGTTWYPVFDPPNQPSGQWMQYTIDLDLRAAQAGMALGSDFKIKFQQYDNFSLTTDGRGWDDIRIPGVGAFDNDVVGAVVDGAFPPAVSCTWTCAVSGGATCISGSFSNLLDTIDLPAGGQVRYTGYCDIDSAATGDLVTTVSVTSPAEPPDPSPADNTAIDTNLRDGDGDGTVDANDNCPDVFNPDQNDSVHVNGIGDLCDDPDLDGVADAVDTCPDVPNPVHVVPTDCNNDSDTSDAGEAAGAQCDRDTDGVGDVCDNCVDTANSDQIDLDIDGEGDACDLDDGRIQLRFDVRERVDWQPEAGFDPVAPWNTYRGDFDLLVATGDYTQAPGSNPLARRDCGLDVPWVDDPDGPTPGGLALYLTSGNVGGVESDLGTDGDGAERPNSNPCP